MADLVDPHDFAAIESLAASGLWERAGLVEALRLLEMLKNQQTPHTVVELPRQGPQTAPFPETSPNGLELADIERELIGDILTLSDEQCLTTGQILSLLGQVSVLIELVKRGQAQKPTKSVS